MSEGLPDGWAIKRLDEFCERVTDGTHDSPKRKPVGIRLITSKNLKDGKIDLSNTYFISLQDFIEIEKRSKVDIGDVIFGMIGTIGNPVIVRDLSTPFAIKNVALFKLGGDFNRASWIFYYLSSCEFKSRIDKSLTGNAQKFIGLGFLREFTIPEPPQNEIKKIAKILTSVDEVIEATESQINKLKDLKKGMMSELLTKGIGHTEFKDSAVGRIPMEWEIKVCSEVCKEIVVGIVIKPSQYYQETGIPALRSANVREVGLNLNDVKYISSEANNKLVKSRLNFGDILTVRTGYPGTSAVVTQNYVDCNCIDLVISRPLSIVNSYFYCYWINSDFGKKEILKLQGGLAQQHFNVGDMKKLAIALPSISEQKKIVSTLTSIDTNIEQKQTKLIQTKNLKKSLMADLLTGRVRVKP